MLTLEHVTKRFGTFTVLEDINLTLEKGLYGLLAPNGAGKTTLIELITTLLFPTEGKILYNGVDIIHMGAEYRKLIGYLPQKFGYYKNNTPEQYLRYLAALKGLPSKVYSKEELNQKISSIIEVVGLSEVKNKKMKKLSGGMIQRVGIAQALLNDPKILVLDEPTAGLDPKERVKFRNLIASLSGERIVILSTHIVSDIESIASQVIMLKDSHLHKMNTVSDLCMEFKGSIFERESSQEELEQLEQRHVLLSIRQEHNKMKVRFYCKKEEKNRLEGIEEDQPTLEDVFLITYKEEE